MSEYTKTYQLVELLDNQGRPKSKGSRSEQERYQYWVGCRTNNMWVAQNKRLHVQFEQDAKGVHTARRIRTTPVLNIEEADSTLQFKTVNSLYIFKEAEFIDPEIRNHTDPEGDKHLLELWFGRGPYLFDTGVYYDPRGVAHMLSVHCHSGMMEDSYLVTFRDSMARTVARYFAGRSYIQFYDTLYLQQNYHAAIMIHNTSSRPLTVSFQFSDDEWDIEPGGKRLIQPPARPCDD